MVGVIKSLHQEKGFGFISAQDTKVEHFFHRSAVKNCRFDDLQIGDTVNFESTEGAKGPRAEDIYAQA